MQLNAKRNSQTLKSNGKLERFDRRAKWDRVNVNVRASLCLPLKWSIAI